MTTERKTIIDVSLILLMVQFQEHVQRGWEMDMENPIGVWGFAQEMGLVRTDKTVAAMAERDVDAPPKMTRAEIMAKARAARGQGKEAAVQ